MEKFELVSPAGGENTKRRVVAPPLDTFEGKTVCEVWNGVYKGNETFPILRELLRQQYPGIKIIPYTEFPSNYGGETLSEQRAAAQNIAAMAKKKGCDALISGNGA